MYTMEGEVELALAAVVVRDDSLTSCSVIVRRVAAAGTDDYGADGTMQALHFLVCVQGASGSPEQAGTRVVVVVAIVVIVNFLAMCRGGMNGIQC